jgi:hypothetical protein
MYVSSTGIRESGGSFVVHATVGFRAIYLGGLHAFDIINILAKNGYYVRGIDDRARAVIFLRMKKEMKLKHGGLK